MARTRETPKKSTGGKAPRKPLVATKIIRKSFSAITLPSDEVERMMSELNEIEKFASEEYKRRDAIDKDV